MHILGINGGFGGGYQDASACLYAGGKIIAAVEEERLTKIKFSTGQMPLRAIREVLDMGCISMTDVSLIAFHGSTWPEQAESDLRDFIIHHFGVCPVIRRFHHHDAHAASTFYLSGFEEALVITMDNSGDGIASQIMTGRNGKLQLLKNWPRPNSFGTFYSCMTQLAGFDRDADEYKLMGLAPYGNADAYDLNDFLYISAEGGYTLNPEYIYPVKPLQSFPNKQIPLYSRQLLDQLHISSSFSLKHTAAQKDLAAAAQHQLEKIVTAWIQYWADKTGIRHICLAGGVAMNCVLNRKILESCAIEGLFIPPFAGDQGISIGNAFLAGLENGILPQQDVFTPYSGRRFTSAEIETILTRNHIEYKSIEHPAELAAQYIADGKIIGWFQGGSEIGARALGNRSILANPAIKGMKDSINHTIKFREAYRPFCPSVLAEDAAIYFDISQPGIPYMNSTVRCREITQQQLPEIVHIDNTARVQTVSSENNAIFHQLLSAVKKRTGHGMVINTSLNVRNQPMAYDVNDALIAFFTSGLDAVFIEHLLIEK